MDAPPTYSQYPNQDSTISMESREPTPPKYQSPSQLESQTSSVPVNENESQSKNGVVDTSSKTQRCSATSWKIIGVITICAIAGMFVLVVWRVGFDNQARRHQ